MDLLSFLSPRESLQFKNSCFLLGKYSFNNKKFSYLKLFDLSAQIPVAHSVELQGGFKLT